MHFLYTSYISYIREEAGNTFFNNQISDFAEDLWGVITEYLFLVKSIVFSHHFTEICFKASYNVSRSERPSNIETTSFRWKLQIVLSGGPINSFLPCSIKEQGYFYYSHFWENDKNLITLNTKFFLLGKRRKASMMMLICITQHLKLNSWKT